MIQNALLPLATNQTPNLNQQTNFCLVKRAQPTSPIGVNGANFGRCHLCVDQCLACGASLHTISSKHDPKLGISRLLSQSWVCVGLALRELKLAEGWFVGFDWGNQLGASNPWFSRGNRAWFVGPCRAQAGTERILRRLPRL